MAAFAGERNPEAVAGAGAGAGGGEGMLRSSVLFFLLRPGPRVPLAIGLTELAARRSAGCWLIGWAAVDCNC